VKMPEPYRLFFPLGALSAILGTMLWIAFPFGALSVYPGVHHPDLMIGSFLFAFSAGFLMTAIPQFTGSHAATRAEPGAAIALFLAALAVGFMRERLAFHAISLVSLLALARFAARRFRARTYDPPRFFVFVGLGLLFGIGELAVLALGDLGVFAGAHGASWRLLAKLIYTQGMMLSLILGIGTHLLPAIWGWSDLPIQITRFDASPKRELHPLLRIAPLALLLVLSFFVEAFWRAEPALAIRAGLATFLGVRHWKLLRKPRTKGRLAFWLWISAWSLVLGLWAPAFVPVYSMHALHLVFIGGFGLMTLMIASRVSLAHGGYGVRIELRSRVFTVIGGLALLAAAARIAAPWVPKGYAPHLAYASICWILAVIAWLAVFLPKIVRFKPEGRVSRHSH
jgi:uncharacterized protein involved in response to NO